MFRELAFDEMGEAFPRRGERGDTFDHRLGKMETVKLVEDGHVEGRRGRAFLLIAMDMEVGMVGASIGQPVNERGIAVAKMTGLSVVNIRSNASSAMPCGC